MAAVSITESLEGVDTVVVGVRKTTTGPRLAPGAGPVDAALGRRLLAATRTLGATGALGEAHAVPTLGRAPFPLVVLTGLGEAPDDESYRRAAGNALRLLPAAGTVAVAINGPAEALVEGALLGAYRFTGYKSRPAPRGLRRLRLVAADEADVRAAVRRARVVAEAMGTTRDLGNEAPNKLYPETFAERAAELAREHGLELEVLDERALKRGNYGGLLAVGSGSVHPPRLVRLTYRPKRSRGRVALVGKGITYDSGGLNLKSAWLTWMKGDMLGGAAVFAATVAAARLRLPLEVTATVAMAENLPSGSAYRPSDVVTMHNGSTVEIADTDAEGRVVLGDAIARAVEDDPGYLLEVSTLTGGQMVALGKRIIGAMGEPQLRDRVTELGTAAGEQVWAMPLGDDITAKLKSSVADQVNLPGDRWASMLVGGAFLSAFVPDGLPWVHLDILGPSWNTDAPRDYTPTGATGAGVRTLIAALEDIAADLG